ncbi:DUF4837 family protein [Puteibacter caeruleilacunae]|nr:DUF4837 family protein [Puteibacter caeruleilacunae]
MKKLHFRAVLLALVVLVIASCSDSKKGLKRNISGRPGEVLIVMNEDFWHGEAGSSLRQVLAQPQLALPQDEPIFDLIHIPPEAFQNVFKSTRNIVHANISPNVKEAKVDFLKDIDAYPQAVIKISAPNKKAFVDAFMEKSDKIVAYFTKSEKDRLKGNYKKFHARDVDRQMKEKYDFSIKMAPGFKVTQDSANFVWLRYETREVGQGVFVYWYDYEAEDTFTLDYIRQKRDSVLQLHVHGELEGTYMKTEDLVDPVYNVFKYNGNYASIMRGLWELENDFMGGPFICLSILDPKRNRVLNVDGYVYAPKKDKRELLRQIEAMIYSVEFPDQDHIDKMYREAAIGEAPEES